MDLNKRIRELIDGRDYNPSNFNSEILQYTLENYTECSDFVLEDLDIKRGLERLYSYAEINQMSINKSCIISNSVNGRIAKALLDNIHIFCFDNDYYCSVASQIVNTEKNKNDKIEFVFADISQFFTCENNNNFLADIFISCPSLANNTYKKLDCEMRYRTMTPTQYHTFRGLSFVQKGGIVCSIISSGLYDSVVSQIMNFEIPCRLLGSINFTKGYTFIYLKKL